MGTIADKLTYLNTTKTQLKQMISYGYPLSNETFKFAFAISTLNVSS